MISEATLLAQHPGEVSVEAEAVARTRTERTPILIVLDDDPTGTQSVAELPVLTAWSEDDLRWALQTGAPAVYVLTNTRSLAPGTAAALTREIVASTLAASRALEVPVAFVSRSDSTLRGHFPLETDEIAAAVGSVDAVILVPAFPDAGRVTIGGVHYMRGAEGLQPVAETEFARDSTFGYAHSDLREWVEEKTAGQWPAERVVSLDLGTIRAGAEAIAAVLAPLTGGVPVVVDAVTENDLRLLALGLAAAEEAGARLLYRVGPPFVRARIGQEVHAPLTAAEIFPEEAPADTARGGLVVVGSHVGLTSRQLARLAATGTLSAVLEIDVDAAVDPSRAPAHLASLVEEAARALGDGDVAVHTSRSLRRTDDPQESLDISRRVSAAVVEVVQGVLARLRPRFVIAKGGITSSDVASKGLSVRRAIVRGPMLPGIVSLWEPVDGPAAGIPYIVFAGNVGDDDSLAQVAAILRAPSL
ncbi:four-carbon acid sugar kinase family protein [Rathayibacter oskolensis]|uniref:four-carbon acid sugar kinase family protein n=1 Tax=Rathayibacter oskolensis TaxID=1891671 RepID=UPI00265EF47D|nr:four-carbon acid sugar kinase family protein [Rathayibacter oskolensis]WKK70648.1 four-carbon acid sugar kinase family protein [Rathayibacter oskolensis]